MAKSQKISKNPFFSKQRNRRNQKFGCKKKCYSLSFPILRGRHSNRALQSTPFQNPGGGGSLSVTDKGQTEILVSNFGEKGETVCRKLAKSSRSTRNIPPPLSLPLLQPGQPQLQPNHQHEATSYLGRGGGHYRIGQPIL